MTEKIMENVWKGMKTTGNIDEDDKEIYLFGFYQGLIFLLNLVTALLTGIILDMFLESVLFLICFIPLRIFAGGYHAKTQFRCYVMSTVSTVILLYLIAFLQKNMGVEAIAIYMVAACVVWKLAPVQDKNKPLDLDEQRKYRKKVHSLLLLMSCISGCLYFGGNNVVPAVVVSVVCQLSMILIWGKLKNHAYKYEKNRIYGD